MAATPWYPAWAPMEGWGRGWSRLEERGVTVTRCPHPIPSRPSAPARLAQQAAWTAAAAGPLLARARAMRPDVILAVAPALLWFSGRTGSTWLSSLLAAHAEVRFHGEVLNPHNSGSADAAAKATPAGKAGRARQKPP